MPDRVYGQLAVLADEHGVKTGDLIADSIAVMLGPRPKRRQTITPDVETRIRSLAALNRSQAEIAAVLGMSTSTVSRAAKQMGLETLRTRGKAS